MEGYKGWKRRCEEYKGWKGMVWKGIKDGKEGVKNIKDGKEWYGRV